MFLVGLCKSAEAGEYILYWNWPILKTWNINCYRCLCTVYRENLEYLLSFVPLHCLQGATVYKETKAEKVGIIT